MYRLEPYILKQIGMYSAENLLKIAITYLKFKQGSSQFLQELLVFCAHRS